MLLLGFSVEQMLSSVMDETVHAVHTEIAFQAQELIEILLEKTVTWYAMEETARKLVTMVTARSQPVADHTRNHLLLQRMMDDLLDAACIAAVSTESRRTEPSAAAPVTTAPSSRRAEQDNTASAHEEESNVKSVLRKWLGERSPDLPAFVPRKRLRLNGLLPNKRPKPLKMSETSMRHRSPEMDTSGFPLSQERHKQRAVASPSEYEDLDQLVRAEVQHLIETTCADTEGLQELSIRWRTATTPRPDPKKRKRLQHPFKPPIAARAETQESTEHEHFDSPSSDVLIGDTGTDTEAVQPAEPVKKRRKFAAPLVSKPKALDAPKVDDQALAPTPSDDVVPRKAEKSLLCGLSPSDGNSSTIARSAAKKAKKTFALPVISHKEPSEVQAAIIDPYRAGHTAGGGGGWETASGKKLKIKRDAALAAEWEGVNTRATQKPDVEHDNLPQRTAEVSRLQRQLAHIKEDVKSCERARTLITAGEADKLAKATQKWRLVCRAACEEMLESAQGKIASVGGYDKWREQMQNGNGLGNSWGWQNVTRDEEFPLSAEEKEAFGIADEESFSMEMLLAQLGVKPSLVGWDCDLLRWQR